MEDLVVNIALTGQNFNFSCVSDTNPDHSIAFDRGENAGFGGIELLLMSFSGCVSTALVGLLRRMGKTVGAYEACVSGRRNEQPLFLRGIDFHVKVVSDDVTAADMETALKYAAKLAPVWLAVKGNVEVTARFTISRNDGTVVAQ